MLIRILSGREPLFRIVGTYGGIDVKYRWLKPSLAAQIAFTDWTAANHLRHARFIALRDDKDPREVVHANSPKMPAGHCPPIPGLRSPSSRTPCHPQW